MSELSPTIRTGIADMELDAAAKIAAVAAERAVYEQQASDITPEAAAAAVASKTARIEAVRGSEMVRAENDAAEIAVWGPKTNREYTKVKRDAQGNVEIGPDGRAVYVPVSREELGAGKLAEIRADRRKGKTESERNKAAEDYEREVLGLVDSGYELGQAKLIMDLREERGIRDEKMRKSLTARELKGRKLTDLSGDEAKRIQQRIEEGVENNNLLHGTNDEFILKLVKEEGIFCRGMYDSFRSRHASEFKSKLKGFVAAKVAQTVESQRKEAEERISQKKARAQQRAQQTTSNPTTQLPPANDPNAGRPELTDEMLDRAFAENELFDQLKSELLPSAQGRLGEALNAYAKISAEQRNSHYGRVHGSRIKAFLQGLSKKRSDAMDARVAEQRQLYTEQLNILTSLVRDYYDITGKSKDFQGSNELFTHAKVLDLRAQSLVQLEGNIFDHRAAQANQSNFAKLNNYLAKSWHSHGKVHRTLVVATVPFALAGGIGLATAALPAAASVALGMGVAYGGRKLGQEHARRVNKNMVNQLDRGVAIDQARESARAAVQAEIGVRPESQINSNIDLTSYVETMTTKEVLGNRGRRQKIGRTAAIAAGLGYGAGKLAGNWLSSDQATVPSGENPGGDQGGVGRGIDGYGGEHGGGAGNGAVGNGAGHNGTPTYGDGFNTHNLPWDVANHYVGPNEAMNTVSHAVDVINQQTGAGYSLHNVAGNVQVYLNGHALNPGAQAHFNDLMVQLLKLQ